MSYINKIGLNKIGLFSLSGKGISCRERGRGESVLVEIINNYYLFFTIFGILSYISGTDPS